MSIQIPGLRLGLIGGGQLGRMMAIEARRLGIYTTVLDPAEHPSAKGIAELSLRGSLYDADALKLLADSSDIVTFEIEHTNTQALAEMEGTGVRIVPRPRVLETIQDKLLQKQFLYGQGLPVPSFQALPVSAVATYWPTTFPVVQKARSGGYDGRGVVVIRSPADLAQLLPVDSMVEEYVPCQKELSVLLARAQDGTIAIYPVIEMVFDPVSQICNSVCAPARIPDDVAKRACEISRAAITALDGVGIFAVELFWAQDGRVLINEIAPRPHNSGHWTIEGSVTNQFEQHIRAVVGLPLGSTDLLRPCVMVNLLGAPNAHGTPVVVGAEKALALPGFKLHWYQKETVAPLRKMGHFTVSHVNLEEALLVAEKAQAIMSVQGSA